MRGFVAGLVVLATGVTGGTAATAQRPGRLEMRCPVTDHRMPDTVITYTVEGANLVRRELVKGAEEDKRVISTAGAPLDLGRVNDKGVRYNTLASHSVKGTVLTRRLYKRVVGQTALKQYNVETYDFIKQTIADRYEKDWCHLR